MWHIGWGSRCTRAAADCELTPTDAVADAKSGVFGREHASGAAARTGTGGGECAGGTINIWHIQDVIKCPKEMYLSR